MADDAIELLEAAQCDDGYLNSYYQVAKPGAALRRTWPGTTSSTAPAT